MDWWFKKAHFSWVLAFCGFGFVFGVWLAAIFRVDLWWLFFGVAFTVVSIIFKSYLLIVFGVVGSVCIGLAYGSQVKGTSTIYSGLVDKTVVLTGNVRDDPSKSSGGQCVFQLNSIVVYEHSLPGSVLVTAPCRDALRGDTLTVEGSLGEGFGSFLGSMYRAKVVSVVRPFPGDIGRRVRDWFADKVREAIKDPQASLGIGFLTGQKSALPDDLAEAMKVVGLTHIVVASGYNLTILVRMARRLFVRSSRYLSIVSAGFMVVAFMSVTGLSPSMARAGLVSGLSLLVWYYGGVFHPFVLLSIAATTTVALQPYYAWGDLGWQLSFAAFTGVMIVAPLLQKYFFGEKEPGSLRQILGETVSAHLVTLPIIAGGFGVMSNVAVVANLLVVPLVPLAMLLTFIVGLLVIFGLPPFIVSVPTEWLLEYMTTISTYLSELSWAQSQVDIPPWGWGIYIMVLMIACYLMKRATSTDLRAHNLIL